MEYILLGNYKKLRNLKQLQNLSLLLFGAFFIIGCIFFIFDPNVKFLLHQIIWALYFTSLAIFILSSGLCFILPTNVRKTKAEINSNYISIDDKKYPLPSIQWLLNIETKDWNNKKIPIEKKLKGLPKWGNFILVDNRKLEFIPSSFLYNNIENINIITYNYIPILKCKTSKLFSQVMSILWGIS